jgi:hypothetical protein
MNICITCQQTTRVSRYKKKMLKELKSTKFLDASIIRIHVTFSVSNILNAGSQAVGCLLSVDSSTGSFQIYQIAHSEIRAFNLCFEELLCTLISEDESNLSYYQLKQLFPYLSIEAQSSDLSKYGAEGLR